MQDPYNWPNYITGDAMNKVALWCEISCQSHSWTVGHVVTGDRTCCNAQCSHQRHSNPSHYPTLTIPTTIYKNLNIHYSAWNKDGKLVGHIESRDTSLDSSLEIYSKSISVLIGQFLKLGKWSMANCHFKLCYSMLLLHSLMWIFPNICTTLNPS